MIGGHPDSERDITLITVAGQRRTRTELSPLPLVTAPHQNRWAEYIKLSSPDILKLPDIIAKQIGVNLAQVQIG